MGVRHSSLVNCRLIAGCFIAALLGALSLAAPPAAGAGAVEIEKRIGWLSMVWGDPPAESELGFVQLAELTDDAGTTFRGSAVPPTSAGVCFQ